MEKTVQNVFKVMKFFDNARRNKSENDRESAVNLFCSENEASIPFEILVHWITYISERGSDFRPIWDKGSYVYSRFLYDYVGETAGTGAVIALDGEYLKKVRVDKEETYYWSAENDEENLRLSKYGLEEGPVLYHSRYYPTDYVCIALTLSALEDYDRDILKYLNYTVKIIDRLIGDDSFKNNSIPGITNEEAYVKGIALALYCLTYDDLSFDDSVDFNSAVDKYKFNGIAKMDKQNEENTTIRKMQMIAEEVMNNRIVRHKENLQVILSTKATFLETFNRFYGTKRRAARNVPKGLMHQFDSMKRVWCSLRDYIKDKHYSKCFCDAVFDGCTHAPSLEEMPQYLELPGDVWNNNSVFANCIFGGIWNDDLIREYNQKYNKQGRNRDYELKKLLRLICDAENFENEQDYYPELFDCTFDFVPRMCASNNDNCKFCPFSTEGKSIEAFDKLCVNNKEKKCTIAKICCGYDCMCSAGDCELRKILS